MHPCLRLLRRSALASQRHAAGRWLRGGLGSSLETLRSCGTFAGRSASSLARPSPRSGARLGRALEEEPVASSAALAVELSDTRSAASTDILGDEDDAFEDDGVDEEDSESDGYTETRDSKPGRLARMMWACAKRGVRAEWVWSKYAQQVLARTSFMNRGDTVLTIVAFARIKWRDPKVLEAMSPFMLSYIADFTTREIVTLLNAHKKLEWQRLDNVRLLMNALMPRQAEWTSLEMSLAANALAHFYVYEPRFWKAVAVCTSSLVWSMNPLQLCCLVSALARVDRRDPKCLRMIARMCRRCARSNLFSQETLATTMNAFAKLDYNHPRLAKALESAALAKIDRALALGRDHRRSNLRGQEDVFDIQALVRVLHTLVCLVGCSRDVAEKLLTLISWIECDMNDYQRRALRTVGKVLRGEYKDLYSDLDPDVKRMLRDIDGMPGQLTTYESRWGRELRNTLQKMKIEVEAVSLVDGQVLDILLPSSNAVVCAVGPYSYYTNTTHRTAYSKLHQRLLEFAGYQCMVVPYYEWAELRVEEDKMVYLWSLGRRTAAAAAAGDGMTGSEPAPLDVGVTSQTDLEDMDEEVPREISAGL